MSPDRNPVSGEYTVLVIKPVKEEVKKLVELAKLEFKSKIMNSLSINYRELEPEVAQLILRRRAIHLP